MKADLTTQTRDLFAGVDEQQQPIGIAEITFLAEGLLEAETVGSETSAMSTYERRPWWRNVAVAGAAAAAVLVLIGGIGLLNLFMTESEQAPPVDDPDAPIGHYELDWDFVPRSTGLPLYSLDDSTTRNLISTPAGLLMPDTVSDETSSPLMFRSVDGTVWTSEPTPGGIQVQVMRQFNETFLVEGAYGRVFTSSDGSAWVEEPGDDFPDLAWIQYLGFDVNALRQIEAPWPLVAGDVMAALNDKYMAFRSPSGADTWRVATSDDGATWTAADLPEFDDLTTKTYSQFGFFDIRDGVLMFSGHHQEDDERAQTRLLMSTDGLTWTDVTPTEFGQAPGIKATSSGWVAGGGVSGELVQDVDGATEVSSPLYVSRDGVAWAELVIHKDPLKGPYFHVAIAGETIIRWGGEHTIRGDYQVASLTTLVGR